MSFTTYANYIGAFAHLSGYTRMSQWDRGLASIPSEIDTFLGGPAPRNPKWAGDLGQIERSLRNAWGTELLLLQQSALLRETEDLARIVATWAIVQTYYTGYHGMQALIVARGRPRPQHHPETQSQFVVEWAGRKGTLDPWTMKFDHKGHGRCSATIDDELSNLSYPTASTAHSLAAKALKTTWQQAVDTRADTLRSQKARDARKAFDQKQRQRTAAGQAPLSAPAWYNNEKRNLTADDHTNVAKNTTAAGLLHFLFRVRIKANYVDAQAFTDGPTDDFDAVTFVRDLTYLAAAFATAHEHRVRHEIGAERLAVIRQRWCEGPGRALPDQGPAAPHRRDV